MPRLSQSVSSLEGILIAIDALRANRVRAALTILGIAIGVIAVVVMSAAINGVNGAVARELQSAGPTSFQIFRFPIVLGGGNDEEAPWRNNPPVRMEEVYVLERLPGIRGIIASTNTRVPVRWRGRELSSVQVRAKTPNWLEATDTDVKSGRTFTTSENVAGARVAVINEVMARRLFDDRDPLGRTVLMRGAPFEVIGVWVEPGNFFDDGDRPSAVVPMETARRHLAIDDDWLEIEVRPLAGVPRDQAIDDVTAALRGMRRLRPAQENDFAIVTQEKLYETYNRATGAFFLVMIALSGIGLLVGGVGVVAIMMISVTERTREIGVRKALGATRRTILWQFLVEAATLTAVGATCGLVVGWLIAWAIRSLSTFEATIPPGAIVSALLASILTGVVFGLYPAAKAARLDPVEALRHE